MMSRRLRYAILLGCLFAVTAACSKANTCSTCYISYSTGNDKYDGTSETHPATPAGNAIGPWQHAPFMVGCNANCGAQTPISTDRYIFKGGDVWPSSTMPWVWNNSGAGSSYPAVYLGYDPAWNNGTVVSVRPTTSGYKCTAITVTLLGGGGSGATATGQFVASSYWAGNLQHVTVTDAGGGYTSNPTVSFAGSTCTTLPTAVADINSPVFDGSGTIWTTSNLYQNRMISFTGVNNAEFDHLEIRGLGVSNTVPLGTANISMFVISNSDGVVVNANYIHDCGVKNFSQSGTAEPTVGTECLSMNEGYPAQGTIQNSFFDNYEMQIIGPCGWTPGNTPGAKNPYCNQAILANGADVFTNNVVHDARGLVYDHGDQNQVYSGNQLWDGMFDSGSQHGDGVYFHGGGYIFNNVIHNIDGGSNYLEFCTNANCDTPNTIYLFNNIFWDGTAASNAQNFWNIAGEFASASTTWSTPPAIYIFNNSCLGTNGVNGCFGAGQWFNAPNALWAQAHLYLYNNLAVTNQTAGHWYMSNSSGGTCTNPNGCGTWNGLLGPMSSATEAAIDAVNLPMTQSAAAAVSATAATKFLLLTTEAAPMTFAGTNFTTAANGLPGCNTPGLSALCADILGHPRPANGSWKAGAYASGGPGPGAPAALTATPH